MSQVLDDQPAQGKTFSGQQPKNPRFAATVTLVGTSLRRDGHLCREYRSESTGTTFCLILETEDRRS
jgi:hypothetical protein